MLNFFLSKSDLSINLKSVQHDNNEKVVDQSRLNIEGRDKNVDINVLFVRRNTV